MPNIMADTTQQANESSPVEEEPTETDQREEWEIQRDEFKAEADALFRSKSYSAATSSYESALQFDPTNHILLSNKSAAHLANGEKSKALHDARKCVEHAPKDWAKGHTRLAAAMAALGRYSEAIKVYSSVLNDMDADNEVARRGLEDCRAKERQITERKKEEALRVQTELDRQRSEAGNENKDKSKPNNVATKEEKNSKSEPPNEEDDLLDDFFSEVEQATEKPKPETETGTSDELDESKKRIKIQLGDLGTSASQIDRLLQTNYEWKNLNPFYVLDMPHTVDDESIISARYRALSLLVHPDKNTNDAIRAKAAFEQVKKAMEQMGDENKRRHVSQLVEQGHKQGKRDWDEELAKRTTAISDKEKEEGLAAAQSKATMKIFASIEAKRRDVERRKRKFEQRERAQEDEEKDREKKEHDHDKKWRETGRVEKRVGNWRDFQKKKG